MTEHNIAAVILAAGKGTRMKSALPKVLHKVAGRPMLGHVMEAAMAASCEPLVVVTAPDMPEVAAYAKKRTCLIAHQEEQLGTGHAVQMAQDALADFEGHVVVLFGDSPLILPETIEKLCETLNRDAQTAVAVFGFDVENPPAYGRLITSGADELERIVESKDASAEELAVTLCNSGVMAIRGSLVWNLLAAIDNRNAQEEYYLTDIIAAARKEGYRCKVVMGDETEALGVNSRKQLSEVETLMQTRLRDAAMEAGVTMTDPASTFLCADTVLGQDVILQPGVFIGPDVTIGDGVEIKAYSHLEGCVIGDKAIIGPYARIRPGSNIGEECKIGNFVELKKAELESGVKVSHLSYIGDAHVGEETNIGAGTITCNYDGYNKHHTEIGKDVFIGSNSALVAPVVIGSGAFVGAGSVVTENVAADGLAIARSRQEVKAGWGQSFRERMEKEG
jgi:bifunctional UDP-N-acetylglucosamine pyrophosphorylase/glucosamine-1-phosphate N-acetyltransferase